MSDVGEELVEIITGAVAQGWCIPPNTSKVMDCDLASAIVNNIKSALPAIEAEIEAKLREPGPCGKPYHLQANQYPYRVGQGGTGTHCTICEELSAAKQPRDLGRLWAIERRWREMANLGTHPKDARNSAHAQQIGWLQCSNELTAILTEMEGK